MFLPELATGFSSKPRSALFGGLPEKRRFGKPLSNSGSQQHSTQIQFCELTTGKLTHKFLVGMLDTKSFFNLT